MEDEAHMRDVKILVDQCGPISPADLPPCLVDQGFSAGCAGCIGDHIGEGIDQAAKQCSGSDIATDSLLATAVTSLTSGQCNDSDQSMFSELGKDVQYCYQDGSMGG